MLFGLIGQVVDARDNVVEDYEEQLLEACFEMLIRLILPRLPNIYTTISPEPFLPRDPLLIELTKPSSFVYNQPQSHPRSYFIGYHSLLTVVTLKLCPSIYELFASIDQMLCLLCAGNFKQYLRYTVILM